MSAVEPQPPTPDLLGIRIPQGFGKVLARRRIDDQSLAARPHRGLPRPEEALKVRRRDAYAAFRAKTYLRLQPALARRRAKLDFRHHALDIAGDPPKALADLDIPSPDQFG